VTDEEVIAAAKADGWAYLEHDHDGRPGYCWVHGNGLHLWYEERRLALSYMRSELQRQGSIERQARD